MVRLFSSIQLLLQHFFTIAIKKSKGNLICLNKGIWLGLFFIFAALDAAMLNHFL